MVIYDEQAVTQQAEREWNSSPAIRKEFLTKDAYLAFKRAEAKGLIKVAAALKK